MLSSGSVIAPDSLRSRPALLVTTSQSILLWSIGENRWSVVERGYGLYYGVAFHNQKIYVGARKRMVSSSVPAEQESGEIRVFDQTMSLIDVIVAPFPLRDIHQIVWQGDTLLVTCSYDNMVAVMEGDGNWSTWYPLGKSVTEPYDVNHFNSLISISDEMVGVVAHNLDRPSELLFFQWPNRELRDRISIGSAAHDLWRESGQWFTCSSREGAIRSNEGFFLEVGGFPRGVAFGDGFRYLGISEFAERNERDFTDARLHIYSHQWQFLEERVLEGEGLILDVKLLPF